MSATLLKRQTLAQVFSCEFCEISNNTYFTKHLWTTASDIVFEVCKDNLMSTSVIYYQNISVVLSKFMGLRIDRKTDKNDFIRQTFFRFINYIEVTTDNGFNRLIN